MFIYNSDKCIFFLLMDLNFQNMKTCELSIDLIYFFLNLQFVIYSLFSNNAQVFRNTGHFYPLWSQKSSYAKNECIKMNFFYVF